MAKKQRGKTGSFLKTSDIEKTTKTFSLALESSEDEAPEEVTFEDSKAQALRSLKRALDTAKREKELLKEKRRKKQELFQEQKKRKLLPVEVLEEIDSSSSEKQNELKDGAEEAEDGGTRKTSVKLPNVRTFKGNYTVTATTEQIAAAAFQRRAAEDFIQSRLYGPGSCRGTNNELLSVQNKRGEKKSAAVQFVKKGWACDKKAKAEKMNKRWIHKQQISSS